MVFSSSIFLFLFLPLTLLLHLLAGPRFRNAILLLASLLFYAWGEQFYVLLMLASIVCNYFFGCVLERYHTASYKKWLLAGMLILNLLPLIYFKYTVFLVANLSFLGELLGITVDGVDDIRLPIGISFFTFQAMSYLIDVYRQTVRSQSSVLDVGLYIALFPQLIAGPIVRYHDVCEQIKQRVQSMPLFVSGIERFVLGLGKKVLIANPLGYVADTIFALPESELSFATVWIGIICYALQIYFDFSGYSDMAIGLGRMLGFRFLENFNYPYIATSVKDFWRRWHISLSSWFRDYLYIPLGGNRGSQLATMRNLFIVFIVCGLWHGASWNFVIWGLLHGLFLVLERGSWGTYIAKLPLLLRHLYVLIFILTTWVFFRVETLEGSLSYLDIMYSWPETLQVYAGVAMELDMAFYTTLTMGLLLACPVYPWFKKQFVSQVGKLPKANLWLDLGYFFKVIGILCILFLAVTEIAVNSYNPFIYFRF